MLTHSLFLELICSWLHFLEYEKKREIPHNKSMREILSYINDNLEKKFTVSYLAKRCLMSERQFRTIFEKHTGMSPKKYINQNHLQKQARNTQLIHKNMMNIVVNLNLEHLKSINIMDKNMFALYVIITVKAKNYLMEEKSKKDNTIG